MTTLRDGIVADVLIQVSPSRDCPQIESGFGSIGIDLDKKLFGFGGDIWSVLELLKGVAGPPPFWATEFHMLQLTYVSTYSDV